MYIVCSHVASASQPPGIVQVSRFGKNFYSSHAVYRICRFDSSSRCRDFRARLHRNRVPVPLFTHTIGATLFQAGIGLWSLSMPLQGEHVHPKSLPFQQQRLVVHLRDVEGLSWHAIAGKVKNRMGHHPSVRTVGNCYRELNSKVGRRVYKYHRCGRPAWKVTKEIEAFIVKRLVQLRRVGLCTSTTLRCLSVTRRPSMYD